MATVVAIWCLLLGPAWLLIGLTGAIEWASARVVPSVLAAVFVPSIALILLCRSERISDLLLVKIAFVFGGVLCGMLGYAHAVFEFHRFGVVTSFGPFVLILALFPMLLPLPPRLTVKIEVAYSCVTLLGIWLASVVIRVEVPWISYLEIALVLAACSVGAYAVSRGIYSMQRALVRARRLGAYRLEEKIGEGGMGEVWRASHRMLARPAAVKLILPERLAGNEEARENMIERFSREAQATASLESPHTVKVYDFGVTDDGTFYFTMELLDGIDLETLVSATGQVPPERVLSILLQVCDSLGEAHDLDMIHRDIKPANIMLCRQGRRHDIVKVLDFGLVTLRKKETPPETSDRLTGMDAIVGTTAFMAPEALLKSGYDARSDIYSVGCLAFWLLTGKRVFESGGHLAQAVSHLRDEAPAPSTLGVSVPDDLEGVVLACLAKRPEDRPRDADDLAERLSACRFETPWSERRAAEWWEENEEQRLRKAPLTDIAQSPTLEQTRESHPHEDKS